MVEGGFGRGRKRQTRSKIKSDGKKHVLWFFSSLSPLSLSIYLSRVTSNHLKENTDTQVTIYSLSLAIYVYMNF